MVNTAWVSRPPVTTYFPAGRGKSGFSMMSPCSSSHQSSESKVQPLGARPPIISRRLQSVMWTPRGPGSSLQMPHLLAPTPFLAAGSPRAAMNWVLTRTNLLILLLPLYSLTSLPDHICFVTLPLFYNDQYNKFTV